MTPLPAGAAVAPADRPPDRVYRWLFAVGMTLFGASLAAGLGSFLVRERRLPGLRQEPLADADSALGRGDSTRGVRQFREMAALNPWTVDALLAAGEGLARGGRHAESQAVFDRAHALRPGDARIHASQGWSLLWAGQLEESWGQFAVAVKKDPRQASAYAGLGEVLLEKDRYGEARSALLRSIEIDPGQAGPYNSVGITYAVEGRPDVAVRYFLVACSLSSSVTFTANLERARAAVRHAAPAEMAR